MPSQDGPAIGIDFAEGDGSHSGAFEAEREAADAAEKVEDIHGRSSMGRDMGRIGKMMFSPMCSMAGGGTRFRYLGVSYRSILSHGFHFSCDLSSIYNRLTVPDRFI